jgi:hypothetical protein
MEPFDGEEDLNGINDDPILQAAFVAELERVVGAEDLANESHQFQWILPVTGLDEILAVLRRAPSDLGVTGLEGFLRAEFGTLSGLKAIVDDSDERDV